jgi:hypothetical protein
MKSVYYEASEPDSMGFGRYSGSPIKVTSKWLETQGAYTLYTPAANEFPRRKTFAEGTDDLFQANLADMRHLASYNDGFS